MPTKQLDPSGEARYLKLTNEKQAVDNLLSADELKLRQLQAEITKKQVELEKLRAELRTLEESSNEVAAAKNNSDEQVQSVSQERDTLNKKLGDAQQAYQSIQVELTSLKTERDQATMRSVTLQKQVDVLVSENRDQQRKLGNQDQYLSADRDIRDLMGARQLYMARGSSTSQTYLTCRATAGPVSLTGAFSTRKANRSSFTPLIWTANRASRTRAHSKSGARMSRLRTSP